MTLENAMHAAELVRRLVKDWDTCWERTTVTVFCEAQRAFKTILLYWFLLPELRPKDTDATPELHIRFETVSWERANPLLEITKLFNELLMLKIPFWRRYMRNVRIRKSQTR